MSGTDTTGRLGPVIDLVERFVASGQVDGVAVAVGRRGEQVAEWYVGEAAPGLASDQNVLWPLGSISKLYTATVVMELVERGELTLSTTVRSILPEFEGQGRERVTLRHLLTHTSGLIYEAPRMEDLLRQKLSLDELVDDAYQHPPQFSPGSRFSYSDFGFALAGRMAATVTETPFPELVRSFILEPGELQHTFMPPSKDEFARLAHVDGALAAGTDGDMYNSSYGRSLGHPAFGTVASVSDLLRFGQLFSLGGKRRLLSDTTIRTMTTDQTGGDLPGEILGRTLENPQPWGLGFVVRGRNVEFGLGELASQASFGHPGATGCVLWVDPAEDITVAFVSNRHINTGFEPVFHRLSSVINVAIASMTDRSTRTQRQLGFR